MTVRKYLLLAYRQAQGSARFWYKYDRVGLDLLPLAAAVVTAPLGLITPWLLLVPIGFLLIQMLFVCYAEWRYKGKSFGELARVFPLVAAFFVARFAGVVATLWRIATGGERAIRESKRAWKRSRAAADAHVRSDTP
jgi:hypothetical protein